MRKLYKKPLHLVRVDKDNVITNLIKTSYKEDGTIVIGKKLHDKMKEILKENPNVKFKLKEDRKDVEVIHEQIDPKIELLNLVQRFSNLFLSKFRILYYSFDRIEDTIDVSTRTKLMNVIKDILKGIDVKTEYDKQISPENIYIIILTLKFLTAKILSDEIKDKDIVENILKILKEKLPEEFQK